MFTTIYTTSPEEERIMPEGKTKAYQIIWSHVRIILSLINDCSKNNDFLGDTKSQALFEKLPGFF